MSKLTKYTAPIASIDSMGFPLQTEQDVYLASDVYAHLAAQGEELDGWRKWAYFVWGNVDLPVMPNEDLRTLICRQFDALQDELEETKLRRSETVAMCDQLWVELESVRGEKQQIWNKLDAAKHAGALVQDLLDASRQQLAAREGQVKDLQEKVLRLEDDNLYNTNNRVG